VGAEPGIEPEMYTNPPFHPWIFDVSFFKAKDDSENERFQDVEFRVANASENLNDTRSLCAFQRGYLYAGQ